MFDGAIRAILHVGPYSREQWRFRWCRFSQQWEWGWVRGNGREFLAWERCFRLWRATGDRSW
jgi:hypothetical protein